MQFESSWPLLFLLAVPAIVILYLLKPKGEEHKISSILLWQKMLRNEKSKTFFEKFIHNILMYVQILLTLLLILALMSPYVLRKGASGRDAVIVIDTSASTGHLCKNGQTRLDAELDAVRLLIDSSDNTKFSIIACDGADCMTLAIGSGDKQVLRKSLAGIEPSDMAGDITMAAGPLDSLYMDEEGNKASVYIFTDGLGASKAYELAGQYDAGVSVLGDVGSNLSVNYVTYAPKDYGEIDAVVGITNYSLNKATYEVSLHNDTQAVLAIRQAELEAGQSGMTLFENIPADNSEYYMAKISAVSFEGSDDTDSLEKDNVGYAVKSQASDVQALMVGNGNTYLEKAYKAVTGMNLEKIQSLPGAPDEQYDFVINDAAEQLNEASTNRLAFVKPNTLNEESTGKRLNVTHSELTEGFDVTQIGVNKCVELDIPAWGQSFLTCDGKSMGYYGEHDGIREIVVGFDIRESDFALTADFPIFMANAINYLAKGSILSQNEYTAGQYLSFRATAGLDIDSYNSRLDKIGIYRLDAGNQSEYYAVNFPVRMASDATVSGESSEGAVHIKEMAVQKTLRRVFLGIALILLLTEWGIYLYQNRYKGYFYWISRALGVLLLSLAMLGVTFTKGSKESVTIFVADVSQSNAAAKLTMENDIRGFVNRMPGKNRFGIVAFGKTAQVDRFLTEEKSSGAILTSPDNSATDIEGAISRAIAMIPADASGRIVVLTDGRQTRGEVANTAKALAASDIELLSLLYQSEMGKDAYVENVSIPTYLHPGDLYSVRVTVESNYDTDANLLVRNGSFAISESKVHLNKGSNSFVLQQTVSGENLETFTVEVVSPGDECADNNAYNAYAVVEAPPRVLIISGMAQDSKNTQTLVAATGYECTTVSARNAPSNINGMLEYRTILLDNVYLGDLPEGFVENIESYVKDYGYGLVCVGGEHSYAMGAYKNTPLEAVLPVSMTLTGTNQSPEMSMVMVIDHSGSMSVDAGAGNGATALDLAIEAAKVAVDNLDPTDKVGVLTFDDSFNWQVDLQEIGTNAKNIKSELENVPDGGGTSIQPALWEAINVLDKDDATLKHIILLTDGQGESNDYSKIVGECVAKKITLSTVAVGDGADDFSLRKLARSCDGRFYMADAAMDIPRIFAEEVYLSGDSYIQNGDFALAGASGNKLISGLYPAGWPNIKGYIATTAKSAAWSVLSSDKYDPILVAWQYGLGHSVAWTSDVTGEWTSGYVGTDDFPALWKRILDYSCGNADMGDDNVTLKVKGGSTYISYEAKDYSEKTTVQASFTRPDGTQGEAILYSTAPGKYESVVETDDIGLYNFTVRKLENGELSSTITSAAAVQYSDEYKYNIDSKSFEKFADAYGRMITADENIWRNRRTSSREKKDLSTFFLILMVLWLLADIAGRRFGYAPQIAWKKSNKVSDKRRAASEKEHKIPETAEREDYVEPEKKEKKKKSPKSSKPQAPTLDTSGLLKKKDERNI